LKRSAELQPLSHEHFEGLHFAAELARAHATGEPAEGWAESLAAFWANHLVPHFEAEEALIVPLLDDLAPLLAKRILNEHQTIRNLVETIAVRPATWETGLSSFSDVLTAHIRFEERVAFPTAEKLADAETLAHVGDRLAELHGG
jgi:hemerythrin-like domain-containing protein